MIQGLIQCADDPVQHPDRNHARDDNQQAGEQPFTQSRHGLLSSLRRWRGSLRGAGAAPASHVARRSGWSAAAPLKSVAYQPVPLS